MVSLVETGLVIISVINLLLFILSIIIFTPIRYKNASIVEIYRNFKKHLPYLLLILGVVFFHLIEVNLIDIDEGEPSLSGYDGVLINRNKN